MNGLVSLEHVAAVVLIALGTFVVVMNWLMVIETRRTGHWHSPIPLFGALSAAVGLSLLPSTKHYAWIPFLVDYGTLALLYSLPNMVREAWQTSRHNLIAEYRGGQGIMTAIISLYRGGICVVRIDLKRAPGEMGLLSTGDMGTWDRDGARLKLLISGSSAEFQTVLVEDVELLRQVVGFYWETNHELSLANVDLVRQR